jgi:endonuclease/exonuclease/phosphatase family metal-dependent hydrolase
VSGFKLIRFAIAAAFFAAAIFFFPHDAAAQSNITLRVMSFNIHHAEGLDGQIDTQRIADLILQQNADLVGLQEVDRGTTRVSGRDLIAELAQKTEMSFVFSNNLSYQGGQYGNATLTRFPIKFREHRFLPKVGSNEQRGWLKAVVDVNGTDVSFWTTHLAVSDETERLMCVTNFNNWLNDEINPVIFCGDFNATPSSQTCALMRHRWDDSWTQASQGNGYTIPVPSATRRIDYVWVGNGSRIEPVKASVPFSEASDHFPVLLEVTLTHYGSGNFYFSFDEPKASDSNVVDSVSGLTGTFSTNSPARSNESATTQPGDRSFVFDGTQRITVPDPEERVGINGVNGNYTLQAWVKLPLHLVPAERMILFQYERVPGFSFSINTNRTLHTTTFRLKDIPSSAALPDDAQWHHVAVVHTVGVDMKFFVDGALAATVSYTNGIGSRASSNITIGSAAGGANPFTGFLDRISFHNEALSAAQLDFPATIPLGVRKTNNSVVLFLPATKSDYKLQTSCALSAFSWSNADFTVVGNENQATFSPSNAARFFRLRK